MTRDEAFELVCLGCGQKLAQHYCNHNGGDCQHFVGAHNGHGCPAKNPKTGVRNTAPEIMGSWGWFSIGLASFSGTRVAKSNAEANDKSNDWRAWQHNVPGECPCGIPRKDCDYHR